MTGPTLDQIKQWAPTCTMPELAAALGISVSHTYELAKSGGLPFKTYKFGSRRVARTADLVRWLEDDDPTPNSDGARL